MHKLIKLEKDDSFVYKDGIKEYLSLDFAYIPFKDNYRPVVRGNEAILKGSIILENNLNKILSPISGKVIGTKKMFVDNKMQNTLVIENDFKEKEKALKGRLTKYDSDSIISKLYDFYFKYIASVLETKKIHNLILECFDDEPYVYNNSYISLKYSKELLEMLDILGFTFKIPNIVIVMKSNDNKNIDMYLSKIGTYPNINISLCEDFYLIKEPFFLLESMNLREDDSLVLDCKSLLEIYHAIKYNRFMSETFITIAGNAINKSVVVSLKVGTLLKDVVKNTVKVKDGENEYIIDGLMRGVSVDINNTVVSKNTNCLIINKKCELKESKCNNCGLCYKICPVKVNPKKIMDEKKISNNCIDCGLCSYICPCNINLRKFLRGDFNE